MPSVTINEKGIVSESGSGFSVNDGPLLPHVESMVDSASFTLQCQLHDDGSILEGDPGYLNSLNGTVDDGGGLQCQRLARDTARCAIVLQVLRNCTRER